MIIFVMVLLLGVILLGLGTAYVSKLKQERRRLSESFWIQSIYGSDFCADLDLLNAVGAYPDRDAEAYANQIVLPAAKLWCDRLAGLQKSPTPAINSVRTHRSLNKDAPVSRPVQRTGVISSRAILGGLHHRYVRV